MLNNTNVPGLDGFVWWTGIVEGRQDPEKLSRVQVRMYVWHTDDKSLIPTDKLLWAHPVFPTNNTNETYCPKEGDAVFGFYIDGKDAQQPYIFGRFPDKPAKSYSAQKGFSDPGTDMTSRPVEVSSRSMIDGEGLTYGDASPKRYPDPLDEQTTSRFARNQNIDKTPLPFVKQNVIKDIDIAYGGTWSEVDPDYGTVYPFNDSKQSESGHYFDIDDTRKKERINIMHRTGTMCEFRHTGSVHRKDLKHAYQIVHGSKLSNIRGNLWTTVERYTRFRSKGHVFVEVNADVDMKVAKNMHLVIGDGATTGTLTIDVNDVQINAKSAVYLNTPLVEVSGVLRACSVESFFIGPLFGTAAAAIVAGSEGTVAPLPPTPSCGAEVNYSGPEVIDNPEAPIDEINYGKKQEEKSLKDKLQDLFAAITASGTGGRGAKWCYINSSGSEICFDTHHATGDGDIFTYIWCSGGRSATSTDYPGQTFTRPVGYTCPL